VPFCVAAVYRGSRIAYLEIAVAVWLMFICGTRTPFIVTVAAVAAAFLLLAPSFRVLVSRSAIAVSVLLMVAAIMVVSPFTQPRMYFGFERLTGMQTVSFMLTGNSNSRSHEERPGAPSATVSATPVAPNASTKLAERTDLTTGTDENRVKIAQVVHEIISERGLTLFGIGYGDIERIYGLKFNTEEKYGSHNIFVSWALELGFFGLAVVALLLGRFFWLCATHFRDPYFRCLGIGMVGLLADGLLHPIHHGPMMFILLGLGYGAADRVHGMFPEVVTPMAE
jgi:hypothetical protein